ncbi:MAG TPA: ANTAR domain-containing protein [Acidimicrobiales bacterium]|nr:ANTAR domain-containing protein [Acidimicrobiales bacterium]
MDASSLSRMLAALAAAGDDTLERRLCSTCVELLGVDGASIVVSAGAAGWGALCSSDVLAATLLDLQHTLGEGPTLEAYHATRPVGEVALGDPDDPRWLAFSGQAHAAGAAAVFAYPLRAGAARVGVLTLHQRRTGPLRRAQHADALLWADALTDFVLAIQAQAPPRVLAAPLEAVAAYHAEVHQAAGILAARLEIGIGEALVRLRAHAYAKGRLLADVAREVITGTLRIE